MQKMFKLSTPPLSELPISETAKTHLRDWMTLPDRAQVHQLLNSPEANLLTDEDFQEATRQALFNVEAMPDELFEISADFRAARDRKALIINWRIYRQVLVDKLAAQANRPESGFSI